MDFVILRRLYWQNTSLHQRMLFISKAQQSLVVTCFLMSLIPAVHSLLLHWLLAAVGEPLCTPNRLAMESRGSQSPTRQGKSLAASRRAAVVSSSSFHLQFKLLAHGHALEDGSKSRITERNLLALKLILREQPLQALLREFFGDAQATQGFYCLHG